MKIASGVDVIETGDNLAKDVTYKATREGATLASLDEMVKVAFHGLEDEAELPGIWEKKKVVEGNNVRMKRNCAEGLREEKED